MQFKLTTDYALRTMILLATKGGVVPAGIIAREGGIAQNYVPKIMKVLKDNGFIDAIEGIKGGFYLKVDPSEVTVYDIVSCFENTMNVNRCLEDDEFCSRNMTETCLARKLYQQLQVDTDSRLKSITLAELIEA
jgi:Rrf2 family protein